MSLEVWDHGSNPPHWRPIFRASDAPIAERTLMYCLATSNLSRPSRNSHRRNHDGDHAISSRPHAIL